MAIEAFFLSQGNRLGDRLHANSQQSIRDELHCCPRATATEIKVLFGDRAEDRLRGLKELLVSAAEECQRTLFSLRGAARDRRIQKTSLQPRDSRCTARVKSRETP